MLTLIDNSKGSRSSGDKEERGWSETRDMRVLYRTHVDVLQSVWVV